MQQRFLMQDLDSFRRLNQPLGDQPVTNLTTVKGPEFLSWIHDKLQRVFERVSLGAPVVEGLS
jgi:hypothetical protein